VRRVGKNLKLGLQSNVYVKQSKDEIMQQMQNQSSKIAGSKILSRMSQRKHEKIQRNSSFSGNPTEKNDCKGLCKYLFKKEKNNKNAMYNMWRSKITDASSRLRQAITCKMGMQKLPRETFSPKFING